MTKPGCVDPPTRQLPLILPVECDECGGRGCAKCGGRGRFAVGTCPKRFVRNETLETIELIDFAADGSWPMGHGTLHETQSFTDAFHFFRNACAIHDAEFRKNNPET